MPYVLKRLLLAIPTFIGITVVCFALTRFLPGGPVEMRLMRMRGLSAQGEAAQSRQAGQITDEYRKQLEASFGFDKPLLVQYWDWLVVQRAGLAIESYDYPGKTAWQLIRSRIPISLWFGVTSFLLTYLICIPLGIVKALWHTRLFDSLSSVLVFAAYAMPSFSLATLLNWALGDYELGMTLPVACYVAGSFALLTLLMKNSLLDQISADYIRTVIAKGGSRTRAVWFHALRNSLIPVATGLGSMVSLLFAGSIIIETVFEIPGMGRLSWDALVGRDYAVFLALLVLTSLFQLVGNLIGDLLYLLIDPRIGFDRR